MTRGGTYVRKSFHSLLNHFLRKCIGYQIVRNDDHTMEGGIKRCKERGLEINTVIDVGASNGSWSKDCMRFYKDASYFLIEAQEPHEPYLNKFKNKHNNVEFIMKVAGNKIGEIYFDKGDLFGGLASENPFDRNFIIVSVTTVESEVENRKLKPPYLLKLDTHGYDTYIRRV